MICLYTAEASGNFFSPKYNLPRKARAACLLALPASPAFNSPKVGRAAVAALSSFSTKVTSSVLEALSTLLASSGVKVAVTKGALPQNCER